MFDSSAVSGRMERPWAGWLALCLLWLGILPARAYPPAPHHVVYGLVRDQYGTPLDVSGSQVILATASGRQLTTKVLYTDPGVNYRMEVPMDAGLTSDLYKATAMQPTMPFQIKVIINKGKRHAERLRRCIRVIMQKL